MMKRSRITYLPTYGVTQEELRNWQAINFWHLEGPQSAKSHPLTAAIKTCFRGWPVSHLARSILGTALLPSCLTPQVAASASSKTRKSDPEIVGGCSLHRHDPRHVFAKFLFKISDLTRVVAPGVGVGVGCRCSTDRRLVTRRSSSRRYVVTSCRCHEPIPRSLRLTHLEGLKKFCFQFFKISFLHLKSSPVCTHVVGNR